MTTDAAMAVHAFSAGRTIPSRVPFGSFRQRGAHASPSVPSRRQCRTRRRVEGQTERAPLPGRCRRQCAPLSRRPPGATSHASRQDHSRLQSRTVGHPTPSGRMQQRAMPCWPPCAGGAVHLANPIQGGGRSGVKLGKLKLWDLVVDKRTGKVGRVMGSEGPRIQLRPPGGGREWDADPEDIRAVDDERLRAGVAEAPVMLPEGTA